jgi:hypothetical protein
MKEAYLLLSRIEEARDSLRAEAQRFPSAPPPLLEALATAMLVLDDALATLGHFRQICDELSPGEEKVVIKESS